MIGNRIVDGKSLRRCHNAWLSPARILANRSVSLLGLPLDGAVADYFGDMTMVICRPSIRGICSTLAISSRSSLTRIRTSIPNS